MSESKNIRPELANINAQLKDVKNSLRDTLNRDELAKLAINSFSVKYILDASISIEPNDFETRAKKEIELCYKFADLFIEYRKEELNRK